MIGKLFGLVVLAAFLTWCSSVGLKGMGPSPAVVFEALIGDPADVTDLDGFVRTGDGYKVQIRFRVEDDWVRALPNRGFFKSDCSRARQTIRFSWIRVAAWPPWTPEDLVDADCYHRTGENEWSPDGRDVLLVEPEGGWAYFAGEGREYDRVLPESDEVDYPQDR